MPNSVTVDFSALEALKKRLAETSGADRGATVKVGVLSSAAGKQDGKISVLELAAIHEFGSPAAHIPQRSFIRSTFTRADVQAAFSKFVGSQVEAIISLRITPTQALGRIGAWAVSQIKQTIRRRLTTSEFYQQQALRPETIARKGSSTPLIDTGQLINAVTWEVG